MKSAVSIALVVSLIGPAWPVAAQDSAWWRVRALAPGIELILLVKGSQQTHRYFVAGDEFNVTVLNVSDPALPAAARDVLRNLASTHPDSLLSPQKGGRLDAEKHVRVGPDGVFVDDRKVADMAQVVERYRRQDILEISTAPIESNAAGCALAGYYGGGLVGGLPGAVVGGAVGRDTGPALVGMLVGWSVGAVYMYRKCKHKPEKVIYSAP